MIDGWWQLAEWTPRLLLALGGLIALMIVVVIARHLFEIFRR